MGNIPHIAFCFASVESCMLSVIDCWSMAMYGGICIDSSPSGPLTLTVDMDCVRAPFPPDAFGGITLNVTPGGTESGSDPIFDSHRAVVVKVLGAANRGKRNVGNDSADEVDLAMACAHRRRAGANMVLSILDWLGKDFGSRECEVAMFSLMVLSQPSSRLIRDFLQTSFVCLLRSQARCTHGLNTTIKFYFALILSCCMISMWRRFNICGCMPLNRAPRTCFTVYHALSLQPVSHPVVI